MDLDSFHKLQEMGLTGNFNKVGQSVVASAPRKLYGKSNNLYVARLIMGAKQGEYVRNLSGNSLNLRKENLKVIKAAKPGKFRDYNYLTIND